MKKTASAFLFLFSLNAIIAQDTIIKYSKDKVIAKILEISPEEVKYKKFDFQDGPTYIDKKSDIKMIIFANGVKETFYAEQPKETKKIEKNDYYSNASQDNKIEDWELRYRYHNTFINQPQMQKILMQTNDPKIMNLVNLSKDSRRKELIGFATIPFAIAAIGSMVYALEANEPAFAVAGGICIAGAITCPILSGINRHRKVKYNSTAIKLYNQKF